MPEPRPWHVLFVAAFPCAFLYARNAAQFDLTVLLRPLGITLAVCVVATGVMAPVLRDVRRAGLLVSLWTLAFFSYGRVLDGFSQLIVELGWVGLGAGLRAIALLLLGWASYRVARVSHPEATTRAANGLGAALLALQIVVALGRLSAPSPSRGARVAENPPAVPLPSGERRPHIFHIVLDGYGRADMLRRTHGFDNGPFLAELARRGFQISPRARSNYAFTQLSLPSMLAMGYLTPGESLSKYRGNNRVRAIARRLGYRWVAVASGFSSTEQRDADEFLEMPGDTGEFERALWAMTPVAMAGVPPAELDRRRIRFGFSVLPALAQRNAPQFVFAHLIAPHPPYVFASDGSPTTVDRYYGIPATGAMIRPGGLTRQESVTLYVDQMRFVNGQVLDLVDRLLATAAEPPLIVIHSDHGPVEFFDASGAGASYLDERFSVLMAIRWPPSWAHCSAEVSSLVNLYRQVLGCGFGADLPLLEDRAFLSDESHLYDYRDVTGALGTAEDEAALARLMAQPYFGSSTEPR